MQNVTMYICLFFSVVLLIAAVSGFATKTKKGGLKEHNPVVTKTKAETKTNLIGKVDRIKKHMERNNLGYHESAAEIELQDWNRDVPRREKIQTL